MSAIDNCTVAGDYKNGLIHWDRKKKCLAIHQAFWLRPTIITYINKDTVESYEVVMQEGNPSMTSGVVKGAVGGALFGGIGALAGATSGNKKGIYTVSIVFKNETKCLCELETDMYKKLVQTMY